VTAEHELLLDASRLVWRAWRGRPATGIDRVCLAYAERFGDRALAVIQRRGLIFVLSAGQSRKLWQVFRKPTSVSRAALLSILVPALASARRSAPRRGMTYLNVGHTGLNEPSLSAWLARNEVRPVYLVHDLIPLTHPEFCRAGEAEKHRLRLMNVLASAKGVIANSRDTLEVLARFARSTDLDMPASIVAWLGTRTSRPRPAAQAGRHLYFVMVGTIEARKNHLMLLGVWERLLGRMGEKTPDLIIIGERGWEVGEVLSKLDHLGELAARVREISDCSDDELAKWIAGSRALLMPSFAEGFGLPVVEALDLGTPVIASDLPVFREIAGDIPTYLDPRDSSAWETAIRAFAEDGAERKRQLARIPSFRAPSWDEHFQTVETWLAQL
jgi:glycosyltransferase involved in cell wall biosynthesis